MTSDQYHQAISNLASGARLAISMESFGGVNTSDVPHNTSTGASKTAKVSF